MHPVIRIITFLVLVIFLSRADSVILLAVTLVILFSYLITKPAHIHSVWPMLKRLRWLFLSMFILYLWFTPGTPVVDIADSGWVPTYEGLQTGLLRIAALVLVVLAVNLLIKTTPVDELLAALYWLAGPLQWAGVSREQFAVRMMLVMDIVPNVHPIVQTRSSEQAQESRLLTRMSNTIVSVFKDVLEQADATPERAMTLGDVSSPPLYQWMWPLFSGMFLWLLL